jgi:hypothetical protein
MMRTSLNGGRFHLRRGSGAIRIHLEKLQLSTGSYSVQASVLNESDCVVLTPAAPQSKWFFVQGNGISSSIDSGVFEPSIRWSQTSHADETMTPHSVESADPGVRMPYA